jgi:hypothetical protein
VTAGCQVRERCRTVAASALDICHAPPIGSIADSCSTERVFGPGACADQTIAGKASGSDGRIKLSIPYPMSQWSPLFEQQRTSAEWRLDDCQFAAHKSQLHCSSQPVESII